MMKKLMMTLALTACVSAMQASEKADTTVIENAKKVTIIADDSTQTIQVKGREGDSSYRYENTISTKNANCSRRRSEVSTDDSDWNLDVAFGFPIATNTPSGMSFAPFKSYEWILGLRYCYTPKNALQTYSAGLWCNWRQYTLDTDKLFDKNADGIVGLVDYPEKASDKRSSVYVFSLSVPLMFTQKFGRTSKFKFSLGPVFNFNLYGRLNSEYTVGDYETEVNVKGIDYRPVTIDIMGILHWSKVGVYCKYSPMSVLKDKSANGVENPQFRSVSVGVFF